MSSLEELAAIAANECRRRGDVPTVMAGNEHHIVGWVAAATVRAGVRSSTVVSTDGAVYTVEETKDPGVLMIRPVHDQDLDRNASLWRRAEVCSLLIGDVQSERQPR